MRALMKDHGEAFGITYGGAYLLTYIPIFAALEVSNVDAIAMAVQGFNYLGFTLDLSWLENSSYLNKHVSYYTELS